MKRNQNGGNSVLDAQKLIISLKYPLILLIFWGLFIADLIFIPPSKYKFPTNKVIKIGEGLNLKEIENYLKENKVIKSSFVFDMTIRLLRGEKEIKAGEYLFDKPYSGFEIAKKIITGDYGIEYKKILIKEGMTIDEIGNLLEKEELVKKDDFLKFTGCCARNITAMERIDFTEYYNLNINPFNNMLEGYFFPDTYFFPKNADPGEIIKLVLKNFNKKITDDLKEEILTSGRGFYDILIMASILEKEAITYYDKQMVADILWKRLDKNMALQVDASLQYTTGKNTFELSKKDLKENSPYNTYKYKGLPITPISNPGIQSIRAAIFPKSNPYWFYMSDEFNIIHYSEDYDEHKSNVAQYLRAN